MQFDAARSRPLLVIVFSMIAAAAPITTTFAEENPQDWQPPPPMPDEFDWIQLTSGEWLKGEIFVMYEDSLEFESDELDVLTLDWEDVQQIRSARIGQVAFLDDTIATGKLLVDGDTVRVMGEKEYLSTRSQVLSLTAGVPKESNYWSSKISAGINLRSGNTEQTDFNAKLGIQRRTPKNRINIDYLGNFSESDDVTIADDQRLTAGWNWFLSKRFYVTPVSAEIYRDPFKNIANRWTLGVGVGYQIIDTSKVGWSVDAGIAYQQTSFDDVIEGEPTSADTPALVAGTNYDNELTGWMDFFFDYKFYVVNQESGTYTHHLLTGFEFEIFGDLDFDVSFVWDRTQDPRQNSDGTFPKQDDFRMIFGLGYSF